MMLSLASCLTACGGAPSPLREDRPVVFESDELLAESKAKANAGVEPYYSSWKLIESRADSALEREPAPSLGKSATKYRQAACADFLYARSLVLAFYHTGNADYLHRALYYLLVYAECEAGTDKHLDYSAPTTDGEADIGLNIAAPLATACDVFALIYPYIEDSDVATISEWIRTEAELVKLGHEYWIEKDCYGAQYGNNHLTSHLMGLAAAAYALDDGELLDYVLRDSAITFPVMIERAILMSGDEVYSVDTDSDFADGEIYDRYRVVQNHGFAYSIYHLKFLTHTALILKNNGVDYFNYTADGGESLKLSFLAYADYLIRNDSTLNGGHYSGNPLDRGNAFSIYRIAGYIWDDDKIDETITALENGGVKCYDVEQMGDTAGYLFGN